MAGLLPILNFKKTAASFLGTALLMTAPGLPFYQALAANGTMTGTGAAMGQGGHYFFGTEGAGSNETFRTEPLADTRFALTDERYDTPNALQGRSELELAVLPNMQPQLAALLQGERGTNDLIHRIETLMLEQASGGTQEHAPNTSNHPVNNGAQTDVSNVDSNTGNPVSPDGNYEVSQKVVVKTAATVSGMVKRDQPVGEVLVAADHVFSGAAQISGDPVIAMAGVGTKSGRGFQKTGTIAAAKDDGAGRFSGILALPSLAAEIPVKYVAIAASVILGLLVWGASPGRAQDAVAAGVKAANASPHAGYGLLQMVIDSFSDSTMPAFVRVSTLLLTLGFAFGSLTMGKWAWGEVKELRSDIKDGHWPPTAIALGAVGGIALGISLSFMSASLATLALLAATLIPWAALALGAGEKGDRISGLLDVLSWGLPVAAVASIVTALIAAWAPLVYFLAAALALLGLWKLIGTIANLIKKSVNRLRRSNGFMGISLLAAAMAALLTLVAFVSLTPTRPIIPAATKQADTLVTKVEQNLGTSGITVSFRNGVIFREDRDARRLTVIFPSGEKKVLEDVSLSVGDVYINVISKAEHRGKPVVRHEHINREGRFGVIWLSYFDKDQPDSLHGVEIYADGRAGDGSNPLGGSFVEIPIRLGDGSYLSHGVTYVPLIPIEWLRD